MEVTMFYRKSISDIRVELDRQYPGVKARNQTVNINNAVFVDLSKRDRLAHVLWECDMIEKLDTRSLDDALRASLHIGWIFALLQYERMYSLKSIRELLGSDVNEGLHKPH